MTELEPKLAPPGAGIPFPAKLVLRLVINPFFAGKEPLIESRARFLRKHARIAEEFSEIAAADRGRRVLVPRQRGLEDSSRYWSAAMVLEHLEIVGSAIGEAIIRLANGQDPNLIVDTAAVKPLGVAHSEAAFASFERFRNALLPSIDSRAKDLNAPGTLVHPWFGPFTARKWYWLLGIHADIHLRQLRAIRARL